MMAIMDFLSQEWGRIYQQTIGTKTYFFENICLSLIHFRTFLLWAAFKYKLNHKQSRYVNRIFFSSGKLLHKFLHISIFQSIYIKCLGIFSKIIRNITYWKQCSKALESSFLFRLGIAPLHPILFDPLRRGIGLTSDMEGGTSWTVLTFSDSSKSFLLPCPDSWYKRWVTLWNLNPTCLCQ